MRYVRPGGREGTEALGKLLRAAHRTIHDLHVHAALLQRIHGGARCPASAKDQGTAARHIPTGRAIVEVGDKTMGIRVAAAELSAFEPKRVDGADRFGGGIAR